MSSRAIRRLREEQQGALLAPEHSASDEEEDDEPQHQKGGFLGMLDEESSDESSSDETDDESEASDEANDKRVREVAKPTVVKPDKPEEEDIDAILSSFHHENETPQSETKESVPLTLRSLLLSPSHGYDIQSLDLDHAVRSLLGGAVVGNEEPTQRGNRGRKTAKKYLFGRPRETWGKPPSYVGGGLGCRELTEEVLREERHSWGVPWPYNLSGDGGTDNNDTTNEISNIPVLKTPQKWYTLITSDTYQEQQHAYNNLLRSRNTHHSSALEDPNALAMFVADHPHFAETLLQLSMVLYHVNDRAKGNDLLRRTMYLYETALPSSVLPHTNTNGNSTEVFMDADRQPNAGLFATLFRIMQTSGMAGCHANALNTGRFLLSLDPLRDPMGVLLILDYYALACRQSLSLDGSSDGNEAGAVFVKELVEAELVNIHYKDPLTERHWCCGLKDMPGWAYSYALALYRLSKNDGECQDGEGLESKADEALVDALTRFPTVLPKLLAMNKVNTQDRSFLVDWPKVLSHFTGESDEAVEGSVQDRVAKGAGIHLVRIFVQRNHKLYASDDVLQWMFRCAERVVEQSTIAPGDNNEMQQDTEETTINPLPRLTSKFHPALAGYAQFDPSEYEDAFRTLPPEAIALDPNIIAPAMEFNPNRRGRFLRRGQMPEEMHQFEGGPEGLMQRLREALGVGGDDGLELLDPDSPLLQLYLQSLLPWNHVDGVRPPR